jgi:hypothetical protein
MKRRGIWVFDVPLVRDPIFIGAFLLGLGSCVYFAFGAEASTAARVFKVATAIPSAILVVGIVGGSVREYRRALKHRE